MISFLWVRFCGLPTCLFCCWVCTFSVKVVVVVLLDLCLNDVLFFLANFLYLQNLSWSHRSNASNVIFSFEMGGACDRWWVSAPLASRVLVCFLPTSKRLLCLAKTDGFPMDALCAKKDPSVAARRISAMQILPVCHGN